MGLFSTLGSLAGLIIPGVGPLMGAALGGIGSLLDGDSPKQAIKNAVLAGVGNKFLSPGIQGTKVGGAISGALGNAGIGTAKGIADLANKNVITTATSAAAGATGLAGAAKKEAGKSLFSDPGNLLATTALLGTGIGANQSQDASKPQYFSFHTGSPFDTMAEASAEDRKYEEKMGFSYPMEYLPEPTTLRRAQGGYIEGPGTGTSDSVPAEIRQGGVPVQKALLSDGEFVMTEAAVTGAGNGDRKKGAANMYAMMRDFERGQA